MYSFNINLLDFAALKRLVVNTFGGGTAPPEVVDRPAAWVKTYIQPTRTHSGSPTRTYGSGLSGPVDNVLALVLFIIGSFLLFTSTGPLRRQGDGAVFTIQWCCELISLLFLLPGAFPFELSPTRVYRWALALARTSLRVAFRPLQYSLFVFVGLQDLRNSQSLNEKVILTSALLTWLIVIGSAFHLAWTLCVKTKGEKYERFSSAVCSLASAGLLVGSWIALNNLEHRWYLNAIPRRGQEGFYPVEAHMTNEAILMVLEAWCYIAWYFLGVPVCSRWLHYSCTVLTPYKDVIARKAWNIANVVPAPFLFALVLAVAVTLLILAAARCVKSRIRRIRADAAFILLYCLDFTKVSSNAKYYSRVFKAGSAPRSRHRFLPAPKASFSENSYEDIFGDLLADLDAMKQEREEDAPVTPQAAAPTPPAPFVIPVREQSTEELIYDSSSGQARLASLGPDFKPMEGKGWTDMAPLPLWNAISRVCEDEFHRNPTDFHGFSWELALLRHEVQSVALDEGVSSSSTSTALPSHGSLQGLHATLDSGKWGRLTKEKFHARGRLINSDSFDDMARVEEGVVLMHDVSCPLFSYTPTFTFIEAEVDDFVKSLIIHSISLYSVIHHYSFGSGTREGPPSSRYRILSTHPLATFGYVIDIYRMRLVCSVLLPPETSLTGLFLSNGRVLTVLHVHSTLFNARLESPSAGCRLPSPTDWS
ncbi:hypothetical protein GLOTRDRAFT_93436 [Gloeophyllum trabeum ATCC 11539]|uniref:Uncharacterized protein n=1 Tax=Gloeophyllum trabeum (strain ATCC 11539 / FP-39264 / Madison 617) TaxID=670483 RepID=S7RSA4_GLOTA|nr:uncharacterized protein GLOTRDRAFT_93436 [Gloeophyllum trabeum ATCC 11539]EPQ55914.1 hypothetical protein GLOTRDRAFT_93436 [Gloeophyllum trabeum ATCC 11539]